MSDFDRILAGEQVETGPVRACRDCGIGVVGPDMPIETLFAYGQERRVGSSKNAPVTVEDRQIEIEMSVCSACRNRRARAAALMEEHPAVSRNLGSPDYANNLADASLIVLDVLGMSTSALTNWSDGQLRTMLGLLPGVGAAARWSARYAPTIRLGFESVLAASPDQRWLQVDAETRQAMRDAYGMLLRALTDVPHPVSPPSGDGYEVAVRGCLLCGIGTVNALSSQERDVWGPLRSAVAATLGGRGRPEPIYGYLCPTCRSATERAGGALGPTAMERAVFDHLEVDPRRLPGGPGEWGQELPQIDGLQAWCVLPGSPAPNPAPWAHVEGLDELAEGLRKLP